MLVNHVEMDHSEVSQNHGNRPKAKIVTTSKGKRGLELHYKKDWEYVLVKSERN